MPHWPSQIAGTIANLRTFLACTGLRWWKTIITPSGYAILGDSAFVNNTRETNWKDVRARKVNEMNSFPDSNECAAVEVLLRRLYPNDRESAEWEIPGRFEPFRRFTNTLLSDAPKRGILLCVICHSSNYRTRRVGRNPIRYVYCRFCFSIGQHL